MRPKLEACIQKGDLTQSYAHTQRKPYTDFIYFNEQNIIKWTQSVMENHLRHLIGLFNLI